MGILLSHMRLRRRKAPWSIACSLERWPKYDEDKEFSWKPPP